MSDVHSDLHREILRHVPAESLLRFRAVCRAWCFIIDDPSFIKSHTLTHHSSATILLIRDSISGRLYSSSLQPQTLGLTPIKILVRRRGVPRLHDLHTMMSCHGLIVLGPPLTMECVIWNPLTRDYLRLPNSESSHPVKGLGLGYDSAVDDYKVVRIDRHHVLKTRVYSLRSRSWKLIEDCPRDSALWLGYGVYLNGALHWISKTVIMALDLATEEYRMLQLPPRTTEQRYLKNYLHASDGCLIMTCYYFDGSQRDKCLDVWMMMEDVWIKLLSLVNEGIVGFGRKGMCSSYLRLVAYSKGRGEVVMNRGSHFYCFDIRNNSAKKVTIDGLPESFTCKNFEGSLVRNDY